MSRLIYDHAHELQSLGYSLVPLEGGGKRPILPGWQKVQSTHRLIDDWFAANPDLNIGIHCGFSKIAVADCDTGEAISWWASHLPGTPMTQKTPREGLHAFYYDPDGLIPPKVNILGIGLNTRGGFSQIVSSPSYSRERRAHWMLVGSLKKPQELPRLDRKLIIPERLEVRASPLVSNGRLAVRRYIAKIFSVSGCGGHNGCFRAACRLVDAGLSESEAWEELCLWNESNAEPPWTEKELRHKLEGAFGRRR